jgi:hypothetical protein
MVTNFRILCRTLYHQTDTSFPRFVSFEKLRELSSPVRLFAANHREGGSAGCGQVSRFVPRGLALVADGRRWPQMAGGD